MSLNEYGMPTGVQIPPATDFRQNQTASSRYRFRRVLGEGSQAQAPFAMALNSTTDINFRFGAGYVINLSKTRLRISESIQSTTAALPRWVRALPPLAAVRLQTSSGVILFDLQNMDAYMNLVYPFWQRRSTARKLPSMVVPQWRDGIGSANPAPFGNTSGYPSGTNLTIPTTGPSIGLGTGSTNGTNNLTSTLAIMEPGGPFVVPGTGIVSSVAATAITFSANVASQGNGRIVPNAQTTKTVYGNPMVDAPALYNLLPRQYIPTLPITGSAGTGVNDYSTNYMQWDVPLSQLLPHTVCAALQDLYFGTDLLLTVSFQAATKRIFDGNFIDVVGGSNKVVNPDFVPGNVLPASDVAACAAVTGCYYACDLQLATQDNLDLVNSVKQEIAGKGIRIPVQQPFLSLETISQSDTALAYSRVIRLNIARGASLLKAYSGVAMSKTCAAYAPMLNREFCNMPTTYSTVTLGVT